MCVRNLTNIGSDLNQYWNVVNGTLSKKLQWNSCMFVQENACEDVVWKTTAILSWPQCVKCASDYVFSPPSRPVCRDGCQVVYVVVCIHLHRYVWHIYYIIPRELLTPFMSPVSLNTKGSAYYLRIVTGTALGMIQTAAVGSHSSRQCTIRVVYLGYGLTK